MLLMHYPYGSIDNVLAAKCFLTKDSQGESNQLGNRQRPWKHTPLLSVGVDMCGGQCWGLAPALRYMKSVSPHFTVVPTCLSPGLSWMDFSASCLPKPCAQH